MKKQKEFAKDLDVSPQHLNAVLRGRVKPSLQLALGIESLMDIPAETLIPELKGKKRRSDTG